MKKFERTAQQGDVCLRKINPPKDRSGLKKLDHLILAEGEVTGHAHRVTGDAVLMEAIDGLLLEVFGKGATVTHEEHGHLTLAPGTYKVGKIREYDHFAEEAREVRD